VTIVWRKPKESKIKFQTPAASLEHATKFRFKFIAQFVRWTLEIGSKELRTFEVKEYYVPMHSPADKILLEIYHLGWDDALSPGKTYRSYPTPLMQRAYKLGKIDAQVGDDISSIDAQSDEEILASIKLESHV